MGHKRPLSCLSLGCPHILQLVGMSDGPACLLKAYVLRSLSCGLQSCPPAWQGEHRSKATLKAWQLELTHVKLRLSVEGVWGPGFGGLAALQYTCSMISCLTNCMGQRPWKPSIVLETTKARGARVREVNLDIDNSRYVYTH